MAYESQKIGGGSSFADLMQLINTMGQAGARATALEKEGISDSQDSIQDLIDSAQTEEQIVSAQRALNNISASSSQYGDTTLGHQALSNNLENKKYQFDDYKNALEETSDFMNSNMYKTKAEDWQDLDSLYKSKVNEETGEYQYDSISDMMIQEYNKLSMLTGRIQSGKESGFRYENAIKTGEYTEEDVTSNLKLYGQRLNTSLEMLINDETINADEAKQIMLGMDRKSYKVFRNAKVSDIESEIKSAKSEIKAVNTIKLSLIKGNMKNMSEEEQNFLFALAEDNPILQNYINLGDTANASKELDAYLEEAQGRYNTQLKAFKVWDGGDYAGIQPLDEDDFVKQTSIDLEDASQPEQIIMTEDEADTIIEEQGPLTQQILDTSDVDTPSEQLKVPTVNIQEDLEKVEPWAEKEIKSTGNRLNKIQEEIDNYTYTGSYKQQLNKFLGRDVKEPITYANIQSVKKEFEDDKNEMLELEKEYHKMRKAGIKRNDERRVEIQSKISKLIQPWTGTMWTGKKIESFLSSRPGPFTLLTALNISQDGLQTLLEKHTSLSKKYEKDKSRFEK
tara:strand:+ start:12503 stop:14197 length:1695 start_codon:yes stop_codon:yes gene_type:complete